MRLKQNKISEWPQFSKKEINKVGQVLKSGNVNYLYGNNGINFEKNFSKYIRCKYAVAVSNGTVALELCLRSIGIKKNDEVIVSPRSYYASASTIVNIGAIPVFADIDINSQNITLQTIKKVFKKNKTKAILCVHLGGYPCSMLEINKFAKKNRIFVIEDCAQAHGAMIKDGFVGSFGDVSAWSFCNDKIISTGGEGGMITTNSKKIFNFIWSYKDQGRNYNKFFSKKKSSNFIYLHDNIGSNFRLTEMQSVLGIQQLKNLEKNIIKRNKIATKLDNCLKKYQAVRIILKNKDIRNAYYRYYFFLNLEKIKIKQSRSKILQYLKSKKIICSVGSCAEIYNEKYFKNKKNYNISLENAKIVGKTSIAIHINHLINKYELDYLCYHLDYIINKVSVKNEFD